ncbi:MAG: amidohydrolase family protein [Pseudomonadota bacterium]
MPVLSPYAARCACAPESGAAPSRRGFLQAAGVFTTAGLAGLGGCAAAGPGAGRPVVDTHHHFYPPAYQQAWEAWDDRNKVPHFVAQRSWTPRVSIDAMDAAGVRTAVLSLPSTPGLWFDTGPAEAVRLARLCNDYGAQMVRDFPGRFGLFATLPMVDVEASLKEIAYAFDVLKADGVGLQTSYGNTWAGDPAFAPLFDELDRRRAVVYFHPLVGSCCDRLPVGVRAGVIEVPHDTTRAAMSLLAHGTLARCRGIRWLLSHGGGTIPMLAGRIETQLVGFKDLDKLAPDGVLAELKRMYYDTANAAYAPSMAALQAFVPEQQIVYGSDYPYVAMDKQLQALDRMGLPAARLDAIEVDNARRLLPGLARG